MIICLIEEKDTNLLILKRLIEMDIKTTYIAAFKDLGLDKI